MRENAHTRSWLDPFARSRYEEAFGQRHDGGDIAHDGCRLRVIWWWLGRHETDSLYVIQLTYEERAVLPRNGLDRRNGERAYTLAFTDQGCERRDIGAGLDR
ncbi:hypothetical protein MesoLj131b_18190 [Mesorhizobium sp. 131-2-5]|nr:hypothetical protein MesoLj131b_18190 [Mesorhizobium sp. 131-2-5]